MEHGDVPAVPPAHLLRPVLFATLGLAITFLLFQPVLGDGAFWQDGLAWGSIIGLAATASLLVATRAGVRPVHSYVFIATITALVWYFGFYGYSADAPLDKPTAVALPLLLTAVFCGARHTAILGGLTLAATAVMVQIDFVAPSMVSSFIVSNLLFVAFTVATGAVIDREREASKRFHEDSVAARRALHRLVDHVDQGLIAVANDGHIEIVNPAAQQILDHSADRVAKPGAHIAQALPPEVMAIYQEAVAKGERVEGEVTGGSADDPIHARVIVRPMEVVPGRRSAAVALHDLRPTDRVNNLVEEARRDGSRNVLNMVSHQILTPLMPILIKSHILLDPQRGVAAQHRPGVQSIQRNANRAIEMVQTIIEASRDSVARADALDKLGNMVRR